jgi:hypothetical protein
MHKALAVAKATRKRSRALLSSLMKKVSKEIKKIRQLADQPAWPTRTSPFFQACAHGVNQLAQTFSLHSMLID